MAVQPQSLTGDVTRQRTSGPTPSALDTWRVKAAHLLGSCAACCAPIHFLALRVSCPRKPVSGFALTGPMKVSLRFDMEYITNKVQSLLG